MNTNEMVEKYIGYRDYIAAKTEAFDLEMRPYKDAMDIISNVVQMQLQQNNEESVRTDSGTAYLSTTMSARVKDKDALFDFVREADAFDLLVAGVAKDAVKTYIAEHQQQLPPGVEVTYITKCNFRRA